MPNHKKKTELAYTYHDISYHDKLPSSYNDTENKEIKVHFEVKNDLPQILFS